MAEDLETLRLLAASSGAMRVVEVAGVSDDQGDSTLALCEALRATGGRLISIVPGDNQAAAIRVQLQEAGFERLASSVLAGDPMKRLRALNGPVDLLFLSGKIDYAAALQAAMPRLRPGSLVVAHRARDEKEYLDAITGNPAFETTVLDQGSGLGISLLKS
jgi:predicted O-methyltransferase YrrM